VTLLDLLPWWVPWAGPLTFLALMVVWALLVPGAVLLGAQMELKDQPWTEKALLAREGRLAVIIGMIFWPIVALVVVQYFNGPFSAIPTPLLATVGIAILILTSVLMSRGFARRFGQPVSPLVTQLSRSALIWWPLVALLTVGYIAPESLSSPWMIPWTVLAVVGLLGLRYTIDIDVMTGVAYPAVGSLESAVRRAATRCGAAEVPRSFVLRSNAMNAAALPGRNIIVVTERLVDELTEGELEAVMLHEIAHLQEQRSVTARRTVSTLLLLPLLAVKPLLEAGWVYLLGAVMVMIAVQLLWRKVFAAEEGRADDKARELSHQSTVFGEALLKMHMSALIPAYIKRDAHGHLYDRLTAAGVTPGFARIEKGPKRFRLIVAVALGIVAFAATLLIPAFQLDIYDGRSGTAIALAFGWNVPEVLAHNGYLAVSEGDPEGAVVMLEEALARGEDVVALSYLAWAQSELGRCDEAADALARLESAPNADLEYVDFAAFWVDDCSRGSSG
jgi:Zn-dependent protease with chaperone function